MLYHPHKKDKIKLNIDDKWIHVSFSSCFRPECLTMSRTTLAEYFVYVIFTWSLVLLCFRQKQKKSEAKWLTAKSWNSSSWWLTSWRRWSDSETMSFSRKTRNCRTPSPSCPGWNCRIKPSRRRCPRWKGQRKHKQKKLKKYVSYPVDVMQAVSFLFA